MTRSRQASAPELLRLASRAPSAMAANFSQATLGCVSLKRMPEAAKPQSAPAMTFSRPTIRREAHDALGDQLRMLDQVGGVADDAGMRMVPSGGRDCSKTWYSCSCRGLAASNE